MIVAIDVTNEEGRRRECRNVALLQAKKQLQRAIAEINYLVMTTATGERRNTITSANIHAMQAAADLDKLRSEELPGDELKVG